MMISSLFLKILKWQFLHFPLIWIVASCTVPNQDSALTDIHHEEWKREAPEVFDTRIATSKGTYIIEVHKEWAPIGVNRFYNLVRLGYFDDSRFYRVRENFIVQCGIAGKPEVSQVWEKETLQDDPVIQSNKRGFITYAMTGPNTRTTQLYISIIDNSRLDADGFAPIGFVKSGMEIVDSIYSGYDETSGGGMRGGKQQKLFEYGNEYLDREFPKLDKLIKAEIIEL